ncbi:MAG: tetratricopeptide repeat protein [Candidatus Ozemobacteraceae bacterium]
MEQSGKNGVARESKRLFAIIATAILLLFLAAYANHFSNGFHFDDSHTVLDNLFIRDLANIPRFFTDATTFSSLPSNQSYRPIVSASFAIDYSLGGGLNPFFFRLSTFFWFLVQGVLMVFLYQKIEETSCGKVFPGLTSVTSLLAAGLYCLHPVEAETINYVCARSDSLSTLSVVAAFVMYQYGTGMKRYALCLIPIAIGALAKPTAVMFAPLFLGYLLLIENRSWRDAVIRSLPIFIACTAFYGFISLMTPPTWSSGGTSRLLYMATQPAVMAHYLRSLFLPVWLSADSDMESVGSLGDIQVFLGVIFVVVLLRFALGALREQGDRPIAFGLFWFFVALIPTSVIPLAEVANDHRMFFPYVGLVLAVVWAVHRFWEKHRLPRFLLVIAWVIILPLCAQGVHVRNGVWRNGETLWEDACAKSPKNGRAQMNLGLVYMAQGRFEKARELFQLALVRLPTYSLLHINLGVLEAACGNSEKAEAFFREGLSLAPDQPAPLTFYARFLISRGKHREAVPLLERAVILSPGQPQARELLLQAYAVMGATEKFANLAKETLVLCPNDPAIKSLVAKTASATAATVFLGQSLASYREGHFESCVKEANEALRFDPALVEAWNNLCAAHNSLGQFEKGQRAGEKALELRPDFPLAKNNLAWSRNGIASQARVPLATGSESR